MAGFFGFFDYTKPGKGVNPDEPPKKAFFRFWELYWRKFSKYIVLNLLSFAFLLPIITIIFRFFMTWMYNIMPESAFEELGGNIDGDEGVMIFGMLQSILLSVSLSIPSLLSMILLIASVILYGPMMCGMTYILRNYWREEHAWLSDFFDQMKKNFKQGVALGILELTALTTLLFNITTRVTEETAPWLVTSMPVIKYFSIFLFILLLFARNYFYAMAVTFNLKVLAIIKNGFAFAIVGLFRNIGVVFVQAVLLFAILFLPYADIILVPFFFFSLTGFLSIFATFPLIHKHMLVPAMERKKAAEAAENGDDEEITDDKGPA
ncbi:MAG: DUF624 domain-containing protein [Oscillospiraceae bacterium]|nr:DUF624 domain-containing protein [Oscillospiraceae bacterium]